MKILIDNYSDYSQSQPLYFHEGFKELGHQSTVFDVASSSIFDVCDTLTPEFLIMSAKRMQSDVIEYLKQSQNIKLLINIDGLNTDNIKELTAFLKGNNIKVPFLFSSNVDLPQTVQGYKIVKVYQAADTNQVQDLHFDYQVDKAIFINKPNQSIAYESSFHVISTEQELKDNVDIFLPCVTLRSIFTKYNEIIFKELTEVSQLFLNAIYSGTKTYYDNEDDSKIKNNLNKMFKQEFNINYRDSKKITDFQDISKVVSEKHRGNNRAKTILSQIGGV